jgi:hypothetical protein
LKGSLFAIRDDVLLEYRDRVGRFHPFRLPAEPLAGELQEVVESLRILQKFTGTVTTDPPRQPSICC